ncbi:pregnancy-specific glycoprotein 22-like isoform X2 [Peromyscus maniculatus bairdii]|uniref:pregnancy-specific glycoprotein 22-like isoform X2 n=1 Tax=Peromyscus maniculatus bairdii TaxID=230844 RepID=UPI003FD649A7
MEVSSVIPCKGWTSWQGFLLIASLLICCHLATTAKVTIESVPLNVFEGDNVLLHVHNLPENLLAFAWFKRLTKTKHRIALYALNTNLFVPGPVHVGRETVYRNGSLWIQNVTHKDTGFYTLETINRHGRTVSITTMYLHVYNNLFTHGCPHTSARLTIESVPPRVAEGSSVLLLVHNLPENLRVLFWYKGVIYFKKLEVARHIAEKNSSMLGPAHSGRETVYSNGSLLLHNVTCEDMGFYTLRTMSRGVKVESAHVQLQVDPSSCTCCNPLPSGPLTIEPVPRNAIEGESVLLQVHNLPEDLQAFSWYKGVYISPVFKIAEYSRTRNSITQGLEHSGRETVYTNGSLLLQDVTVKDPGYYTLQILNRVSGSVTTHVQFHVNKPVTMPLLGVSDTTVTVQSSVLFSCLSADIGISIRWIFNNQSLQLTERMSLSPMNCGLRIDPVRSEDAGEYKCEVFNPVSSKTSLPVSLVVMHE